MTSAAKAMNTGYMGFATALELLAAVKARPSNARTLRDANTVVLVFDFTADSGNPFYVLARSKTDTLYAILPDSKELVPALHRQNSGERPFLFEVIA